jgi:hypothetical protein
MALKTSASRPAAVAPTPAANPRASQNGEGVSSASSPWAPSSSQPNLTALARSLMKSMESDPESPLNVKMKAAGIAKGTKPFSDSFGVIAEARKFEGVPPEKLEGALRAAIEFAADHYVAHGGKGSPFFRTIELIPERVDGQGVLAKMKDGLLHHDHLSLTPGEALAIEIPKNALTGGRAKPLTAQAIHEQWDSGRQFSNDTMKRLWPVMNPVGTVRTTVVRAAGDLAAKVGLDIKDIKARLTSGHAGARDDLKRFISQQLPSSVPSKSGQGSMSADAIQKIDGASNAELATMLDSWTSTLADVAFRQDVVGEVVDVAVAERSNVRSRAFGLVAVANSHEINVLADATFGASSVRRFLNRPASSATTDVLAVGLIAVGTHDEVNVKATLAKLQGPASQVVIQAGLAKAFSV